MKGRKKHLSMGRIDCRKACDLFPHSWLMDCLSALKVSQNVQKLLKERMNLWRVEMTCRKEVIGETRLRRRIFEGDALSPLLFVISMIPLARILKKATTG